MSEIDPYLGRPNEGFAGCVGCCRLTEELIEERAVLDSLRASLRKWMAPTEGFYSATGPGPDRRPEPPKGRAGTYVRPRDAGSSGSPQ